MSIKYYNVFKEITDKQYQKEKLLDAKASTYSNLYLIPNMNKHAQYTPVVLSNKINKTTQR